MREGHRQSDKHWNCFKGDTGEVSEVHMGLSAHTDSILNWTKATLTIQQGGAQLPLSKDRPNNPANMVLQEGWCETPWLQPPIQSYKSDLKRGKGCVCVWGGGGGGGGGGGLWNNILTTQ